MSANPLVLSSDDTQRIEYACRVYEYIAKKFTAVNDNNAGVIAIAQITAALMVRSAVSEAGDNLETILKSYANKSHFERIFGSP